MQSCTIPLGLAWPLRLVSSLEYHWTNVDKHYYTELYKRHGQVEWSQSFESTFHGAALVRYLFPGLSRE